MLSMGVDPFESDGLAARLVALDGGGSRVAAAGAVHIRPALTDRDRSVGDESALRALDRAVAVVVPGPAGVGRDEVFALAGECIGVAVAAIASLSDVPGWRRRAIHLTELERGLALAVAVAVVVDVEGLAQERCAVGVALAGLKSLQAAGGKVQRRDGDRAGVGPGTRLGRRRVVAKDLGGAVPNVARDVACLTLTVANAVAAHAVDAGPGRALGIRGAASGDWLSTHGLSRTGGAALPSGPGLGVGDRGIGRLRAGYGAPRQGSQQQNG